MRGAVYQAVGVGFSEIARETSAGKSDVDLVDGREKHIRKREPGPSPTRLRGLRDGIAEIGQESHEASLFLALRGVVCSPVLALYHVVIILDRSSIPIVKTGFCRDFCRGI